MDKTTRALIVFAAAACGCAAGSEPARPSRAAGPPRAVRVVRAERTTRAVVTEVVGTVRAVRSATIAPLIPGTVAEVRVGLGSPVRAGEILVRLSAREVQARLEQTRAASALARRERDRAASLHEQRVISAAQYDAAASQWSIAAATQAEASTVAEHALLRAPFAGVVTAKLASAGDTAMPGQPLLVVEAPGALRFEARVPEAADDGLAVGTPVALRVDGVAGELRGAVAELQPTADEATRTRLVKIDLPPAPGLRSGRFGRLLLERGAVLAVSVPSEALVQTGQLEGVFVVDAGVARLRLVRAGRERAGRLEIAAGLAGDERIALARDLVDGQRVEVSP